MEWLGLVDARTVRVRGREAVHYICATTCLRLHDPSHKILVHLRCPTRHQSPTALLSSPAQISRRNGDDSQHATADLRTVLHILGDNAYRDSDQHSQADEEGQ